MRIEDDQRAAPKRQRCRPEASPRAVSKSDVFRLPRGPAKSPFWGALGDPILIFWRMGPPMGSPTSSLGLPGALLGSLGLFGAPRGLKTRTIRTIILNILSMLITIITIITININIIRRVCNQDLAK